ncbi:MAG: chemotaxis protein CheB [Alphaproteobacteria bacterium]|nr:chemotaxis protein CheB [Alphaproteobacteria bacterium]
MHQASPTRDIVVIGGSAGAFDGLRGLLPRLPRDLPAAILIVVHLGHESMLPAVLDRSSALPVVAAKSGTPIEHGRIYVGVPGFHLLLHDHHLLLRRGPRENHARPAVDALFRSAAASLGSRVIGVVLSGSLSDGSVGLRAIKRCGGVAVVQDPEEAAMPSMPRNALLNADIDYVRSLADLPALLSRLVREPAGPPVEVPVDIRLEAAISAQELADMKIDEMLGEISPFTCPECHGALWEIHDGPMLRFRCHVGHAYTADAVLAAQGEEVERMLGVLQRSHQERAVLARRMANRERARNRNNLADQLEARAKEYEDDAQLMMRLIRNGSDAGTDGTTEKARGNGEEQA